ncbi:CinA family protein [Chitinophaga qingshengii]|uniref:CinA family protein n=1 Tax=Chitinophaga qingshengii TaxID=1569794 RepID=A0ABR7TFQ6_9BACT|nr:CinA family protein [Chitinophaga qingshengii]MBC9929206.1 CinA family protein [Chitinophaga qingshengii]
MSTINLDSVNQIRAILINRRQSLAVAESVTAGILQVAFSSADKAAEYFQGGITAYNLGQKARHLGLDPIHGEQSNCVSPQTARTLAENCCSFFSSHWGIGVTGYASTVPEQGITELYAYYSIASDREEMKSARITPPPGLQDPIAVRYYYTNEVINVLLEVLTHGVQKKTI